MPTGSIGTRQAIEYALTQITGDDEQATAAREVLNELLKQRASVRFQELGHGDKLTDEIDVALYG
jgi:hypothetical protein